MAAFRTGGGGRFAMHGKEILGLILLISVAALAIYAIRRGRGAKPDDYRAKDWLGNRDRSDDEDLPKKG
jgi:hypothetical protein